MCGDTFESIVGVAPDAELHALTAVTQGTTYGRSLHSLAGRVQDVRAGAPVEIGAAGYEAAVREQLRAYQLHTSTRSGSYTSKLHTCPARFTIALAKLPFFRVAPASSAPNAASLSPRHRSSARRMRLC